MQLMGFADLPEAGRLADRQLSHVFKDPSTDGGQVRPVCVTTTDELSKRGQSTLTFR